MPILQTGSSSYYPTQMTTLSTHQGLHFMAFVLLVEVVTTPSCLFLQLTGLTRTKTGGGGSGGGGRGSVQHTDQSRDYSNVRILKCRPLYAQLFTVQRLSLQLWQKHNLMALVTFLQRGEGTGLYELHTKTAKSPFFQMAQEQQALFLTECLKYLLEGEEEGRGRGEREKKKTTAGQPGLCFLLFFHSFLHFFPYFRQMLTLYKIGNKPKHSNPF